MLFKNWDEAFYFIFLNNLLCARPGVSLVTMREPYISGTGNSIKQKVFSQGMYRVPIWKLEDCQTQPGVWVDWS